MWDSVNSIASALECVPSCYDLRDICTYNMYTPYLCLRMCWFFSCDLGASFECIDEVLPVDYLYIYSCVGSVSFEVDITESSTSAFCFDVLLDISVNGRVMTRLCSRWSDYSISDYRCLCGGILLLPANGVCFIRLVRCARACSMCDFLIETSSLHVAWCYRRFSGLFCNQHSVNPIAVIVKIFTHTACH